MKLFKYACLSCAIAGIISTQAYADDLKIYSPGVEKGELSAETNLNYNFDHRGNLDNYFSQVLAVEYGVTDWWQTELGGEIEKQNGAGDQLTNIKWENIIAPWKPGENYIDTALYLEIEKGIHKGNPDNFESKLLLEKDINKFVNTANIVASHEFGANHADNWKGGFAWRTKYRLDPKYEPGFEYYANFGSINDEVNFDQQDHMAGPALEGKIGAIKYDTGAFLGISKSAPDLTLKLNLEFEF